MPRPRRCPPGNPSRAVAYLRASTDDQKLGPEAQRAEIERWAQQQGVEVVAWQLDLGVSGGDDLEARPGLVAAVGLVRERRAGLLVVSRRDRLARDVAVACAIERAVAASGARVVSADGVGNGQGDADAFLRTILDAAAAYERALIRSRTKAALAVRKAEGLRVGRVPFGYQADEQRRLSVQLEEQETVRLVLELRASGLSQRAIAAECARRGRVTRVGTPLQPTQVARILKASGGGGANFYRSVYTIKCVTDS